MVTEPCLSNVYSKGKVWSPGKLLGKGKSGYSFQISSGKDLAVLKKIHHEPVTYYSFGDKLQAELSAYEKLLSVGIDIPHLIEFNREQEWLIKDFIPGPTIAEQIGSGPIPDEIWMTIFELSIKLKTAQINVDFFPTNFIWHQNRLFYVDYEWNPYIEEWDFDHWGIWYWVNQKGMSEFLKTGNHRAINKEDHSGKPVTAELESKVAALLKKFRTHENQ